MKSDRLKIISMEIDKNGIKLISSKGESDYYDISLFFCEVWDNLIKYANTGDNDYYFFSYEDPEGALFLVNDFLEKTDYLANATLEKFEIYRSQNDISFDFKIGEFLYPDENGDYSPLPTAWKVYENELKEWKKVDKNSKDDVIYSPEIIRYFSCKTMAEFMFCMIHFYIFFKCKLVRCKHCGQWFARRSSQKTNNNFYCNRKSPFEGYEHKSCGEAVKNIKDKLKARRKNEYERLRQKANEYGRLSKHYNAFISFNKKCEYYEHKIKEGASVTLLKEYEAYLYDTDGLRPKYDRKKNW